MTKLDAQRWVGDEFYYPLTIIVDRYTGGYSGAKYTAWPLDITQVPEEPYCSDGDCMDFWSNYLEPVGKGQTPNDAFQDLIDKINILASN